MVAEIVVQIQEKRENKRLMERLFESPMIKDLQEMEPELLDEEELVLIQEKTEEQGRGKKLEKKPKNQKTEERLPENLKKQKEPRQKPRGKIQELTQKVRKETLLLWMKSKIKKRHKNKQKHETTRKSTRKKKAANTLRTKHPTESDDPLIQLRGLGGLYQL